MKARIGCVVPQITKISLKRLSTRGRNVNGVYSIVFMLEGCQGYQSVGVEDEYALVGWIELG
jgi:hypothetical protein